MQYLLLRKPIVHANPIVEKEERTQQTKNSNSRFPKSPSFACRTKDSNQFREALSEPDLAGQLPGPVRILKTPQVKGVRVGAGQRAKAGGSFKLI